MLTVLFVSYFFPPVGGAGSQRSQKFVKFLRNHDIELVVLAGPTRLNGRWTPGDESLEADLPAEVSVHRIEICARTKRTVATRAQRWCRIPSKHSRTWADAAVETGAEIGKGCDLILATMSPFESAEVGRRLSSRLGVPWVADLRDPWALDEMQVYPTIVHRWIEERKMGRELETASLTVMNTPEAAHVARRAFPSLAGRIISIPNGFDDEDFSGPVPATSADTFRIVHAGALHTDLAMRTRRRSLPALLGGTEPNVNFLTRTHVYLLRALERWFRDCPEARGVCEVILAGETTAADRYVVTESSISEIITLTGYRSHVDTLALVRQADLLFLPMHTLPPDRRARIVPGKTYEYMASGRPILAAVPEGDARDILTECGTAFVTWPDDVDRMVEIINRVYRAWVGSEPLPLPTRAVRTMYERRVLAATMAQALRRAASGDYV
ncbi:MAG: glycosyltransferase [Bryobacteraceae bacterium]